MKTVTVHKAKANLSPLIADVGAGEDVVIMRGGEFAVRLVPANAPAPKRKFGALAGKLVVTCAFFKALPSGELAAWKA